MMRGGSITFCHVCEAVYEESHTGICSVEWNFYREIFTCHSCGRLNLFSRVSPVRQFFQKHYSSSLKKWLPVTNNQYVQPKKISRSRYDEASGLINYYTWKHVAQIENIPTEDDYLDLLSVLKCGNCKTPLRRYHLEKSGACPICLLELEDLSSWI